tara:strand:- start:18666 stop:19082 length:417 start_codon:yes stop_codon:yes gene_type:complete
MNLLKRQNLVFTSLLDDLLLNQDWSYQGTSVPAVNIIEVEDHYDIQLAVPGKEKTDFQIEIEEGVLTIASDTVSHAGDKKESYARKEFGFSCFKRSFNIPETVATDKISATYKEGILTVSLPKKDEALPQPKKLITIK